MARRTRGPIGTRAQPTTEFGQVFSVLRKDTGVSLRELSARLGYAPGGSRNIGKYEVGILLPPPPEVILHWMEALGYPVDSAETQHILLVALDDHIRAVYPEFRRS